MNGVKLENCYNAKVVGVTVKDTPNNGIEFYQGTSESIVTNCRVENAEWHGDTDMGGGIDNRTD